MDQFNDIPWKIIDMYFRDNPTGLIDHHLVSYNDFFNKGIKQVFKESNPIRFIKDQHESSNPKNRVFQYQAYIYLGGKNADRFYYGKPVIYDDNDREHIMYPNEARLRNMTYAFTVHLDVEVDFVIKVYDEADQVVYETVETKEIPKIYLGKFPIMLQSDMCILKGLSPEVRYNMGECRNDKGGYFIVDGKEKVIICQEKFADNTLYIQDKVSDVYSYSAKIRSVSEDASKPVRTLAVRMVAEQPSSSNNQIVVSIPNVRKPVPLFIVMRALGIISDKEIHLTVREFALLAALMDQPNQVFPRGQLIQKVWGDDYFGDESVVDTYIKYLRSKIRKSGDDELIKTIRGVGFSLRKGQ